MNILVIEDHFLVRMGLKIILQELYSHAHLDEVENFDHAMSLVRGNTYDLIMLDIDVPGGLRTTMISHIRKHQAKVPILICSAADEQLNALDYISAGADGFLSTSAEKTEILRAISTVIKKNRYVSQAIQERLLNSVVFKKQSRKRTTGLKSLSSREREITELLISGKWVKEIAMHLNLQSNTVSTYKTRIFEKLGGSTVMDLAKKIKEAEHL